METANRGNYFTCREWFMDVLKGQNVILCYTSAIECHGLFSGYLNECAKTSLSGLAGESPD